MKSHLHDYVSSAMHRSVPLILLSLLLLCAGCASSDTASADSADDGAAENAEAAEAETDTESGADSGSDSAGSTDAAGSADSTAAGKETAGSDAASGSSDTAYTYPVSEEEALEIALDDAGLSEDDVTVTISELRVEEAYACYGIEFYTSDGKKYDYEIDANTGDLLTRTVRDTDEQGS